MNKKKKTTDVNMADPCLNHQETCIILHGASFYIVCLAWHVTSCAIALS